MPDDENTLERVHLTLSRRAIERLKALAVARHPGRERVQSMVIERLIDDAYAQLQREQEKRT